MQNIDQKTNIPEAAQPHRKTQRKAIITQIT